MNCDCIENLNRLIEISFHRYFNSSYVWLLTLSHRYPTNTMTSVLQPLKNISINSDITFAQQIEFPNDSSELFDIFSRGQHLGQPIVLNAVGKYAGGENGGFSLHPGAENRTNFTGVTLRGATVISRRDDVDPATLDDLLLVRNYSAGISNISKYHYALNKILRDMYGFKVRYRVIRSWTGRARPGYRSGLVGVVARNEVDIVGCGAYTKVNRHDEVDNIHQSYKFV